jgi:hypothetical protein
MSEKKINLKTTFKYILENIFRKKCEFWKTFSKNYKGKIGISEKARRNIGGEKRKNRNILRTFSIAHLIFSIFVLKIVY